MFLFMQVSKIKDLNNAAYNRLLWLCENINKLNVTSQGDYDQVMRYLAACMLQLDDVEDIIWKCMLHLANGFKAYISDELYKAFDKHFHVYSKQIAEIITIMLDSANDGLLILNRVK
jgi:hypothetical protein